MEVLMRRLNGEPYVWAKAKFVEGKIMVNDVTVCESAIVSVRHDIRKKYVKCSECGKYFKKGSKKIDQHKEPVSDTHLCFGCEYLRQRVQKQKSQKYELLENGNYMSKSKSEVYLYCGKNYSSYSINSQEARERCKYNKCTNAPMLEVSTFLMEHPCVFDDIITVDNVLRCGYKSIVENTYSKTTSYQLKAKNTIMAQVNSLNIVECFNVYYRNRDWTVYYSKKYDELYTTNGNSYKTWGSCYLDSDVRERIKAKIASLYV